MIRPCTRAAMLLSVASPVEPLSINEMLDRLAEATGDLPDVKGAQYGARILRASGLLHTVRAPITAKGGQGGQPGLYTLTPAGEQERDRLREVAT